MRILSFWMGLVFSAPLWVSAQVTVPMSQYDYGRTGANLQESILNPSNVNPASFGKLFSRKVDADIFALPLIVPNLEISGRWRNVMYVATMRNTVYAFDADDPSYSRPLWKKNLGKPAFGTGILGTPFIDIESGALYVVTMVRGRTEVNLWVNAIDIYTGDPKFNSPQLLSFPFSGPEGTITNVTNALQRPGLLVIDNVLYIAFGNIVPDPADPQSSQEGFVQAFNATDLSQRLGVYQATPTGQKGGIWQAGRGIAADEFGNIYLSTAGGFYDGVVNFGSSTLKLAARSLEVADWFTPGNHRFLFRNNIDLSAGGVTLIPNTELLISGGKEGVIYVLDRNHLGKLETANEGPLQRFKATEGCGRKDCSQTLGTAYWDRNATGVLYVWDKTDSLRAYDFIDDRFVTTPSAVSEVKPGMSSGPSISANGSDTASGIVWAVTTQSTRNYAREIQGILRAFLASDITREIYNSDMNSKRDALGNFTRFAPPVVANGKVYVPTRSNKVIAYGLLCGTDVSSMVSIEIAGSETGKRNRHTQSVTVTNTSSQSIGAPFDIALDNLTAGVRLTNTTGKTSCAEPMDSPLIHADEAPLWLAPGESFTVTLTLRARSDEINYTARVLSGSSPR